VSYRDHEKKRLKNRRAKMGLVKFIISLAYIFFASYFMFRFKDQLDSIAYFLLVAANFYAGVTVERIIKATQ
jgi:hypothetical protein